MSLVELLLALFVISLVSMVGLPAYQDHQVRNRVAEDMNVIAAAQAGIESYFKQHGALPETQLAAGMADLQAGFFRLYLGGFGDYRATLVVVYDTYQLPQLRDKNTLLFKSSSASSGLVWDCTEGGNMPTKYRPEGCR